VKSDIEIARAANKKNIMEIGATLNIPFEQLPPTASSAIRSLPRALPHSRRLKSCKLDIAKNR